MVRIVNGVVVDNDDPRAQQDRSRRSPPSQGGIHQHRQQEEEVHTQHGRNGPAAAHHVSPLATANEKLLALGIPRLQVAGYQLEPLVLVGFLVAFMLLGLPGLLLGVVLFYLHHTQTNNPAPVHNRATGQHR